RSYGSACKAVQLDSNLPLAHAQLGWVLNYMRQHDASIAAFERAIMLNQSFRDWCFAAVLIFAGESGRAIDIIEAHKRQDPFYPAMLPGFSGFAHYLLERYWEALPLLLEC